MILAAGRVYSLRHKTPYAAIRTSTPSSFTPAPLQVPISQTLGKELFVKNGDVYSFDEKTGTVQPVTSSHGVSEVAVHLDRKGENIYYIDDGVITRFNLASKKTTAITPAHEAVNDFLFSSDDKYIAFITAVLSQTPSVSKADGSGQMHVPLPSQASLTRYHLFAIEKWLPNDRLIIRGHGMYDTSDNFFAVDVVTNTVKQFDTYGKYDINHMPEIFYSPNGNYLAYLVNNEALYLAKADGSSRRLIKQAIAINEPVWSPDSKKFAVEIDYGPQRGDSLLVFDTTGKIMAERNNKTKDHEFSAFAWSQDSRFLAAYNSPLASSKLPGTLMVVDLASHASKELPQSIPESQDEEFQKITFAPSNIVYYVIGLRDVSPNDTFPQVWQWDIKTNMTKKISDSASLPFDTLGWIR